MGSNKFGLERHEPGGASDGTIAEFHALMAADSLERRPLDPPTPVEVFTAAARNFPEFIDATMFLARDQSGAPAGFAMITHRRTANDPHLADTQLWANPEYRRQGLAAALLEGVCDEADKKDFRTLSTTTTEGVGWGQDLCEALGAKPTHERRTWRLPVEGLDRDQIRIITSQAADRARGYELIDVESPLPDELLDEAVELLQFLSTEPIGDASTEGSHITTETFRQLERAWGAMGMGRMWQFARHEDSGSLAGVLDAVWNPAISTAVAQDQAVVRPEFRGRSLGLWMKGCMIDKVLDAWPSASEIRTSTVFPNPAMDSVDERLGFVPYLRTSVWNCEVAAVREWLRSSTH